MEVSTEENSNKTEKRLHPSSLPPPPLHTLTHTPEKTATE